MICMRCQSEMVASGRVGECTIETESFPIELETYLRQTFFESLCKRCIEELYQLALDSEQADEFYFEGPLLVFTSHYHFKRGYCCRSKCRHCPYGYAK